AGRQHPHDAVVLERGAVGQRLVGLRWHLPYDTHARATHVRAPPTLSRMIQSMTGYAAASAESPRGRLGLELRSVNARFLDLQFRVAEELRALEPLLRETITARVSRGKVDCRFYFNETGGAQAPQ